MQILVTTLTASLGDVRLLIMLLCAIVIVGSRETQQELVLTLMNAVTIRATGPPCVVMSLAGTHVFALKAKLVILLPLAVAHQVLVWMTPHALPLLSVKTTTATTLVRGPVYVVLELSVLSVITKPLVLVLHVPLAIPSRLASTWSALDMVTVLQINPALVTSVSILALFLVCVVRMLHAPPELTFISAIVRQVLLVIQTLAAPP